MIKIDNYKFYNTLINFEALAGDIVNLYGPDGSGKSTLINLLFNIFTGQEKAKGVTVKKCAFNEIMVLNGIFEFDPNKPNSTLDNLKVLIFEHSQDEYYLLWGWLNHFLKLEKRPLVIFTTNKKKFVYPKIKVLELCK
jgi:ABC-type branched-subunit amino acid transport system ATPase component